MHIKKCLSLCRLRQKAPHNAPCKRHCKYQEIRPSSTVKMVQLHGTGQVVFLPVQLSNEKKTIKTYAYQDNGSCQSLLLQSAALILGIDMNTFGKMPISGYHT